MITDNELHLTDLGFGACAEESTKIVYLWWDGPKFRSHMPLPFAKFNEFKHAIANFALFAMDTDLFWGAEEDLRMGYDGRKLSKAKVETLKGFACGWLAVEYPKHFT